MRSKFFEIFRWVYLWRFLSVGIIGAIVDNLVLYSLVEFWQVPPMIVKFASAESSILVMFILNEKWTFSNYGDRSLFELGRRLGMSHIVRFGGLIVGIVVMYILYKFFGIWYLLANVLGIGVGFIVNYVCESILTWQVLGDTL